MAIVENMPTFESVQWTGDNATDVEQALGGYYGVTFTSQTQQDGSLTLTSGEFVQSIPGDHWYVMGPRYGQHSTGGSQVVDPALYAAKYSPAE